MAYSSAYVRRSSVWSGQRAREQRCGKPTIEWKAIRNSAWLASGPVLGNLDEVASLLDGQPQVILTPHQLERDMMNRRSATTNGISELWDVQLRLSSRVRSVGRAAICAMVARSLLEHCYDDVPHGLFTDQR